LHLLFKPLTVFYGLTTFNSCFVDSRFDRGVLSNILEFCLIGKRKINYYTLMNAPAVGPAIVSSFTNDPNDDGSPIDPKQKMRNPLDVGYV
jgi:hypothetical protein